MQIVYSNLILLVMIPFLLIDYSGFVFADEEFDLNLQIIPDLVNPDKLTNSYGFIFLTDENGNPFSAEQDMYIKLDSSDSSIVSIPENVKILKGENYATFDVISKYNEGVVWITSSFDDKKTEIMFQVGSNSSLLPSDASLVLSLPTKKMHVNSQIPITLFINSTQGSILQAGNDLNISLEFSSELIDIDKKQLILKKGDYFTSSTISSKDVTGNAFVKANLDDSEISTVSHIEITSSKPSSLDLHVFPQLLTEYSDRKVDIFVGLKDDDGFPVLATEDIFLGITADTQILSNSIKQTDSDPVIKEGMFGIHLQPKHVFQDFPQNHTVTVVAEDYKFSSTLFDIVPHLDRDDPKANTKSVNVFVPQYIPTGANTVVVYQLGAVEDDSDDGAVQNKELNPRSIDELFDGELYPLTTDQRYSSTHNENLQVVSSDNSILQVDDAGGIEDPDALDGQGAYGTAYVSTTQKTGTVDITVSLDGYGSGTATTSVVNPRIPESMMIYSPTGPNKIFVDNNGEFELYFLPIDSSNRPTSSEKKLSFTIYPLNDIVEILPYTNFAKKKFSAFQISPSNSTKIQAVPIGIDATDNLGSSKTFQISSSPSTVQIILPFENAFSIPDSRQFAIIQLVDAYGNPVPSPERKTVNVSSSNPDIIDVKDSVILRKGDSFAKVPFDITGNIGSSIISVDAINSKGSSSEIKIKPFEKRLNVFVQYPDNLQKNQPQQIQVFVDDENARPVSGATVSIVDYSNSKVSSQRLLTDNTGEASFSLTAVSDENIAFTLQAYKNGFQTKTTTVKLQIAQDTPANIDVSPLIIFGMIGIGIVSVVVIVLFLLRKPKKVDDDEEYF